MPRRRQLPQALAAIAKISVLIIDDIAIAPPIGARERNDLLELIDDRVGTRSYIVTSQLPIEHGKTISLIRRPE